MKIRNIFMRKIPLVILTLLVTLVSSSYATTTAPTSSTTIQDMNAVVLHITGAFTMTAFTFEPIAKNATRTNPCNWGFLCNTNLTAGDWAFVILLSLNTVPTTTTTYTITLNDFGPFGVCSFNSVISNCVPFNSNIKFTVTPQQTAGTTTDFTFDTTVTQIPQDSAWRITVQ